MWRLRAALVAVLASNLACNLPISTYKASTVVDDAGTWSRTWKVEGLRMEPVLPEGPGRELVDEAISCQPPRLPNSRWHAPDSQRARELEADCKHIAHRYEYRASGALPGETPAGEFRLEQQISSTRREGGNCIHLARYELGGLALFEYRETLTSAATPGEFVADARRWSEDALGFFRSVLTRELDADYDSSRFDAWLVERRVDLGELIGMAAALNADYRAIEAELYRRARALGLDIHRGMAEPEMEERARAWFDAQVAPLFVPRRPKDVPPLSADVLLNDAYTRHLEETYGEEGKARRKSWQREYAGWLELAEDVFFHKHNFELSFRAPGRVVATNGVLDADGTATWEIHQIDFPLAPKTATVLSVAVDRKRMKRDTDLSGRRLTELAEALRQLPPGKATQLGQAMKARDVDAIAAVACRGRGYLRRHLEAVFGSNIDCGDEVELFPRSAPACVE